MSLIPGTRVGYFDVLSNIGHGGMGEVYAARDTRLGRDVALKVLPADVVGDVERRDRFDREARVLASLNHPNIATLHGVETSAGQTVLVMELVHGETLADRLRRGALPVRDAIRIFVQVASALEAAHAAGIVHRDLKPANIKVTPESRVKVLDFGLARLAASATSGLDDNPTVLAPTLTHGVILGTAAYMSPEQARGLPVDRRADVWAFGATLYEALAGRRVFDARTASDTLAFVLEHEPDWSALPAAVPLTLRRLLERCLRKDPVDRLHDIADARIELDDLLHESRGGSGAAMPVSVPAAAGGSPWRSRVVRAGVGLSASVALAALSLFVSGRNAAPPRPTLRFQVPLPAGWYFRGVGSFGSAISVSADGREVVFTAREGLTGDTKVQLFAHRVGELAATPIPDSEGARGPFLSRDSRQLGFLVDNEVKVRQWTPEGSSGGRSIEPSEMRSVAKVDVAFFGADFSQHGDPVYIGECTRGLRAAYFGGDRREKATVSNVFEQEVGAQHQFPQELPGGTHILFTWWSPPESEIRLHSLDTGESRTLITEASHGRYVSSGHIVFAWEGALYAVRFDLKRLQVIGEPVKVLDSVRWESWRGTAHYAVSDEGTLVYLPGQAIANRPGPVWVSRDGTMEPALENSAGEGGGAISPDGSRIAFMRVLGQVWTYEVARGVWRRLSQGKGTANFPLWTPDGQRLVFQYAEHEEGTSGVMNLYWRLADGSGPQERLTKSGFYQQPVSISPDGRTLAFTQVDPELDPRNVEIWMLPLDGARAPSQWLPGTRGVLHPVFSPDGTWIAYASHESGEWQVLVRPASGTAPVEQVSIGGGWEPRWSPDGREIYYRSLDGRTVFAATFQAGSTLAIGRPRVLIEGSFARGQAWGHRWHLSPDGQRLLMWATEGVAPPLPYYHVVLNWFDEVQAKLAAP